MKSFQQNGINFLSDVKVPISIQIDQQFNSKNSRMIHYHVRMSYFLVKIKVFNCIEEDGYKLQFNTQLNHGMFGTVYSIQNPFAKQEQVAVKLIPFNNQPYKIIQNAVKQYALMKVLAALQVGPPTIKLFGYDIVTTSNAVMFSMQRGIPLNLWIMDNLQKQRIHQQFENLQLSLLLLHSLNICHNDIKPSNIIYSPSLRKLIYIDFGFTQVRPQSLGYMGMCLAKGSLYYCSDQMKNIFLTTGQGYVDTYYNDYICLKKSKQFILANYLYNQNGLKSSLMADHGMGQDDFQCRANSPEIDCFADIMAIYLSHLIQQIDMDQFTAFISQRSWAIPLIEQNMKKVCLFFLQMQPSIGLWQIFTKFTQTFINENLLLNGDIKRLIEQKLKPYFKTYLSITFPQQQQQQINYQIGPNSNIQFQKKILKRYNKIDTTTILIKGDNNQYQQQQQRCMQNQQQQHEQQKQQELDLGEQDNQVLERHFRKLRNLHYYQQKQLTQLLMTVFNRRTFYIITQSDLAVLKKCFSLANIKVTHNTIKEKSLHSIFNKYLILLGKYIQFMHNSFDLKVIFSTTIKYYYQQMPTLIKFANQILNQKQYQILNKKQNQTNDKKHNSTNYKKKQQLGLEYNHIEILQLYMFLIQRLFDAYQKNIQYKKNITFLQQHILTFDKNIRQCIELKNIFAKVDKLKILLYLVNIYLQRFVIFAYETVIHAYILAYQQSDYEKYFSLHLYLNKLKSQLLQQRYFSKPEPKRLQQIDIVQHLDQFINLMIISDLVPITMSNKFFVIKRFQLFIKRTEHYQKIIYTNQISAVHFNSKLRLFSLYFNHRQIMKAIKLGNELMQQSLVTTSEICVFIVQSLFRRLNNSKKMKLMTKKVQKFKFSQFISSEKDLVIQNALVLLQNETKQEMSQKISNKRIHNNIDTTQKIINKTNTFNNIQTSQQKFNKTYIQSVYKLWQKCVNSQKYKNKHTQRLYLLCSMIGKLLKQHIPVRQFVNQYYQQVQKYQKYLQTKIKKSMQLKIVLYDTKQMANEKQFICLGMLNEFVLMEYQHFMKCLMNTHNKLQEDGLVVECWQKYLENYKGKVNVDYVSEEIMQSHLEISCKFYQYMYCKAYKFQKQSQKQQQQSNFNSYKETFHTSVTQYIKKFNKLLFDHDFYIIILIGLAQQNLLLKQYDQKWARQQIKKYFVFMIENQQIFYFFYHRTLTKKFLQLVVDIAAEEVLGKVRERQRDGVDEINRVNAGQQLSLQSVQEQQNQLQQQHCSEQKQQKQTNKHQHQSQQQQTPLNPKQTQLFTTLIFTQFTKFIHNNQCLSYQQFFIQLIKIKKQSIQKLIQKESNTIKDININVNNNNSHVNIDSKTKRNNKSQQKVSKQQFILNVINEIKQNLKIYINQQNLKDCWILLIILLTLKINYHLLIEYQQLSFISNCLYTFQNHYHDVVRQVYYMLDVEYWFSSTNSFNFNYNIFNSNNFQIKQKNQLRYKNALNKLFRFYKEKNLVNDQTKYIQFNIIKKIKQRFINKTENQSIILTFENKLYKYLENNLGEQIYF